MNVAFASDESSVFNVRELNASFAVGSLKVMYTGANRNGSFMARSTVERALPSLYNVPIVCHWDPEAKTIGSHDMELVTDDDGNMRLRNLTEPCGVVPESATFRFAVETDENGTEHEYLVVDGVYLWKRQDVVRHIMTETDGHVDHSMEIHVLDGDYDDAMNLYVIRGFEFTALCLLGSAEPCFEGSELEVFSGSAFKQKMEQMMADLRETFSAVMPVMQDNDTYDSDRKGGEVLEYNKDEMPEVTEVKDEPVQECEAHVAEYAAEVESVGEVCGTENAADERNEEVDAEPAESEPESEAQYALTQQVRDEIVEELSHITVESEFGEWPRYWLMDYDPEEMMVYCFDEVDWKLYGFAYTMDGDHVVIDWESRQRMKMAVVPFDEGEQANPIADVFQAASERFQTASAQMQQMDGELNELRAFKADIEDQRAAQEREEILSAFADLDGDEAFEALRGNAASYDAETLQEKCYALRGRKHTVFAKEQTLAAAKLPIAEHTDEMKDEPYHGLFIKFGFAGK
jgi:hypothetical protein